MLGFLASVSWFAGCQPHETYVESESKTEGGSGRYYMGREIADVMSSEHGALWLDRPERNVEELPNRLFHVLDLNPSAVVADIGSGTGFFTFRLAAMVPHGRVYSVEVQQALVDTLGVRANRAGLRNVTPVLGSETNPNLPDNRIDLALIVSSYHEFTYPLEMIQAVHRALKPGARMVIVEYRAEDETIGIPDAHRMSEEQIKLEVESQGFSLRETRDVLPQQHVMVFIREEG
jgi:ubiquinone/menaquinone biosynthesis C-methylase UbiE